MQCVPKRLDYIREHTKEFREGFVDIYYHVDSEYKGCFNSFLEMLKIENKGYRLHLQDDVIIAKDLHKYLGYLEGFVERNNIDVLSLYANPRKGVIKDYKQGRNKSLLNPFLMMQGVVFSPKVIAILRKEADNYKKKYDDTFVLKVLKKYGIKAYCHLPALVQHNLEMVSMIGNPNNEKSRTTSLFDKDYFLRGGRAR